MYMISFHCYYPNGNRTDHTQEMKLTQIAKWIECYRYTHPDVKSISVKVWFNEKAPK